MFLYYFPLRITNKFKFTLYALLGSGALLSIAQALPLGQHHSTVLMGANPLPKTSIHHTLLKSIRSAIAARWQPQQVNAFVGAITEQPRPIYNSATQTKENSFKPFVKQTLTYDNNPLRLADTTASHLARNKADFIAKTSAGVNARWQIQRQELLLNADLVQHWFANFHELDFLGRHVNAQWNWQLGNRFSGDLGYSHQVSRGSFAQLNNLIDNRQTDNNYFVSGIYQFLPAWALRLDAKRQTVGYSNAALKTNDLQETIYAASLRYLTPTQNLLALNWVHTDGRFTKRDFTSNSLTDNAYVRRDVHAEWDWHYSIKSSLSGKIGYSEQQFEHLAARNFAEPTGQLRAHWKPSNKTDLQLSLWRDIRFVTNLNANFVLTQGVQLASKWLITPKLEFTLPVSYETQDYLGNPGFVTSNAAPDQDKITKLGFNVDYSLLENAKMSLFMQMENRSSTQLLRNYHAKSVGLDMQMDF